MGFAKKSVSRSRREVRAHAAKRTSGGASRYLCIPEGKNVGQKLKMADFMKDDFKAIYDNRRHDTPRDHCRGRKNAKTFEAAASSCCTCAARGREAGQQPALLHGAVARSGGAGVRPRGQDGADEPETAERVILVRETAKKLACPKLGTTYRALSADAGTNFGLSPALVIHDELGQMRGPRSPLYEALETATAAQEEPLTVIISTQAPTDADLLAS